MGAITHAQIEPTTRCNFTCGFCAGRSMRQGDLDRADFERFLADHPDLLHVELQGEGEPLLHPFFFEMVAACRARSIAVGLITNGSLLGEAMVERLLDAGLSSIHISLETTDPARFQAIRGGLFAKVAAGIARLATRRRERGLARPVIGLAVTVLADTLDDIPAIHALYVAEGLDGGIAMQRLQTMAVYRDRYDADMAARLVRPDQVPRLVEYSQALARHAPFGSARDFFYASLFAGFDPARGACPWLDHGAYLGIGGAIQPCCFVKEASAAPIGERRARLSAALHDGAIPAPCQGCGTASAIARTNQVHPATR